MVMTGRGVRRRIRIFVQLKDRSAICGTLEYLTDTSRYLPIYSKPSCMWVGWRMGF